MARHWTGFVVVSGRPASGKTTLARSLAPKLGLPLLSKDTIKHGLMAVLPVPNIETSRLLGRASMAALLAVAKDIGYGVLEAPWHRSAAAPLLLELPAPVVEVFCRCDRVTAEARFASRIASQGLDTSQRTALRMSCGTTRSASRSPAAGR